MNNAHLNAFRNIAAALAGPEPQDWEWIGPHMSQRMFGISETRARQYAERHGGHARQMEAPMYPVRRADGRVVRVTVPPSDNY